jgi:asparagine synthase (glutamine-hydrolysing)
MCGIVGVFHLDGRPTSPAVLRRMTDAIAHRGPDGEGFYSDGFVAFGHRRLAIIDLSPAGHQPMIDAGGQHVLTYNGEIYNFQELRAELEHLGHRFLSRTDSEVVLHAYAEWGPACVERFNGMFAFAVWDKKRQQLFLARDRYGIKPLYYCFFGNTLLFASEQKALLAHPDARRELDEEALLEYCTFQNLFTDRTLLRGVRLFPAGARASIILGSQSRTLDPEVYWDFHFEEPERAGSHQEYIEELDRLFVQAVSRQLVSDVDVGSYLSGGLDSGSITGVASRQVPNLKTFTVGFDLHSASGLELNFDERSAAELMSYRFGTEHYEMVLKAGDMARVMPRLSRHLEEPRVGQSYPNFYAAQVASKFVKVVLAGTGGDELFGGYPWRYFKAVVNSNFDQYVDRYYDYWQRMLTNGTIQRVLSPIWSRVQHVSTREIFGNVLRKHRETPGRPEDYVNCSLYLEAKTFLHGLLVVEDKLSMAHGMETRVPFLDNDLVDFAMRIPVGLKVGGLDEVVRLNENDPAPKRTMLMRSTHGKLLLRQAMERHVPSEVLSREKQGFSAPDASWFRGESIEYVRERLFRPRARIYDVFDRGAVQSLVGDHLEGRENRRLLIWSLIYLENWFEQFMP